MSKKYLSRTSNHLVRSIETDMTTMELKTVKGVEQHHSKSIERVAASTNMYLKANALSSSASSVSTNERDKECSVENPSSCENVLSTQKRNHKRKHKHHLRNGKHCHHHHRRHDRTKSVARPYKILSPSKALIKKSLHIEVLPNVRHKIDGQHVPLVVHRNSNAQQRKVTDDKSQTISLNQAKKTNKGNIPLQPIENKLVSKRAAPTSETQVDNYPSSCNIGEVQNIEQILYDNGLCQSPATNYNYPQSDSFICCPQQQELLYCTEPNSPNNLICSVSNNNLIQHASFPQQQQLVQINSAPSTAIQPTFINQTPVLNYLPSPAQSQPAQYLRISSATPQIIQTVQAPSIQPVQPQFIQAPSMQHVQPQFIRAPSIQHVRPQFIRAPSIQPVRPQFIQAPSAQPVQLQCIQAPSAQPIQLQCIQAPPTQLQCLQAPPTQLQCIQAPPTQLQCIQAPPTQPVQLQCVQAPAIQHVQPQFIQAPPTQPIQLQCIQAPPTQPIQLQCIQAPPTQPVQLQCVQAPAIQHVQPQFIQAPPTQPIQLQCVQAPAIQHVQPQFIQAQPIVQAIQASPQLLYQRPYDPVILSAPTQQIAVASNPLVALSQPSYAPARLPPPGPTMFRNALVRTVANRTGVPVLAPVPGGVQVLHPPFVSPPRVGPLGSTARGPMNQLNVPNCSIM